MVINTTMTGIYSVNSIVKLEIYLKKIYGKKKSDNLSSKRCENAQADS